MIAAYVVKGELIDQRTIKLSEPVPFENGEITVVVEAPERKKQSRRNLCGMMKGKISMRDDFNEPLEDFREYME